ncbi:MAG: DNA-directed RNA polymerase subunit B'' [Candidatus Altiarchaeota archaeon]|nr:DNA-directed RNA polymerase subunit B'' [Candidatus Altiarchaeota archaeon]
MIKKSFPLIASAFFNEYGTVRHHIDSFNSFLENGMKRVISEVGGIEPLLAPRGFETYNLNFGNLRILHPVVREADGSSSLLYPMESRIREITYSAPLHLEIIVEKDGHPDEPVWAEIGGLPMMVRSKKCLLNELSRDELMEVGEDPDDPGGYFIINGTERVIVTIEDLIPNLPLVEKSSGPAQESSRIFSETPGFRIPHLFERMKDGTINVSWARVPRVPISIMLMALGENTDQKIVSAITNAPSYVEDVMVNIEALEEVKTPEEAMDAIGKKLKIGQGIDYRVNRVSYLMDNYLLPHIGRGKQFRAEKASYIGMVAEKLIRVHYGKETIDDKDHYGNKRLKMSGELMEQLFRAAFKTLVNDIKYSLERAIKRNREPSPSTIVRSQLLTSRIQSAMATGYWIGGRTGVSQHLQRLNHFDTLSHLRRVMSPLTSSQPHFEARELHPTHWGKLCVAETPEGQNIGLRKNLALLAKVSQKIEEEAMVRTVKKSIKEVIKSD